MIDRDELAARFAVEYAVRGGFHPDNAARHGREAADALLLALKPAATAREEAWKAMVEALAECLSWMRCDCGHPACKRCPATKEGDAALALARSTGAES